MQKYIKKLHIPTTNVKYYKKKKPHVPIPCILSFMARIGVIPQRKGMLQQKGKANWQMRK